MNHSVQAGPGAGGVTPSDDRPADGQTARAAGAPSIASDAKMARPGLLAAAVRHLVHPGPSPAKWLGRSTALLAGSVVACGLIAWAGHARHADPARYFREGTVGTYLSVALLAAAGAVGILTGRRMSPTAAARSFWLILGAFLVFLALDDLFKLHESIDHAWHRATGIDRKRGATAHLDNWIVASYALVAAALFWRHRHYIATLGWFNRTMGCAFAVFVAMVYADTFVFHHEVEDSLKIVAGTLILCAFLSVPMSAGNTSPQSRSL